MPLLTKALQANPDYDDARLALAKANATAGNHRGAIDALAPVADASPRWVEAQLLTAVAQLELREYAAAWQTFTALHARAPSALVLNNMGVVRLRTAARCRERAAPPSTSARRARSTRSTRTTCSTSATPTGSTTIRPRPATGCAKPSA